MAILVIFVVWVVLLGLMLLSSRILWRLFFGVVMVVFLGYFGPVLYVGLEIDVERAGIHPKRSRLLAGGQVYAWYGKGRAVAPPEDFPEHLVRAVVAMEDQRFFEHAGVDPKGVARAMEQNLRKMSFRQGAGTITMQLARNVYDQEFPDGPWWKELYRKGMETVAAMRIENRYQKEEIFAHYLNRIYFGDGYFGIEAASHGYFSKPVSQLTLGESAFLAGIICAPDRRNEVPEAQTSRDVALARMVAENYVSEHEAENAKFWFRRGPNVNRAPDDATGNGYVLSQVRREIRQLVERGELPVRELEAGELDIELALDPGMQARLEQEMETHLKHIEFLADYAHPTRADFAPAHGKQTDYLQGAAVVIDNRTGGILALVGGRNYADSQYCRATMARRPICSCLKPFILAAALENGGLGGNELISDERLGAGEVRGAVGWDPQNADGRSMGSQRPETAVIQSRNLMAIRIGETVGLRGVADFADRAGLHDVPLVPSSYLGAFDVDLVSLTNAYTIFPNNGVLQSVEPWLIAKISRDGEILYRANPETRRVMSPSVAEELREAMRDVLRSGTAKRAFDMGWSNPKSGGKTGTSNGGRDARFVGYTEHYTMGVFAGMDDGRTIHPFASGEKICLPIWVRVMQRAPGANDG